MHGKEKRWWTAQQWGSGSRSRKTGLMTKKAELVGPISIEEEHPPIHVINPEGRPASWARVRTYVQ